MKNDTDMFGTWILNFYFKEFMKHMKSDPKYTEELKAVADAHEICAEGDIALEEYVKKEYLKYMTNTLDVTEEKVLDIVKKCLKDMPQPDWNPKYDYFLDYFSTITNEVCSELIDRHLNENLKKWVASLEAKHATIN